LLALILVLVSTLMQVLDFIMIQVVWIWSDKDPISGSPFFDNWNGSFNHGTSGLGVLGYWGSGFPNYDARLFNFGSACSYSGFGLHINAVRLFKDFSSGLNKIVGSLNVHVIKVVNFKDLWEELLKVKELQWVRRKAEVDLFILSRGPLVDDIKDIWTDDMMEYYSDRCDEIKNDEKNGHYAGDGGLYYTNEVDEETSGSAGGMSNTTKQDKVKLLFVEEKISMCAVIETQVSKKFVNRVGDYVFENWAWVSNFVDSNRKQFVSFVYAMNTERDRKLLQRNLIDHYCLVNNEPWLVLGDFKVTMNVEECSNSFNVIDKDMEDFRRVLYSLDLEDITSYVKALRVELKRVQSSLDKDPDCVHLREEEVQSSLDKDPDCVHLREEEYVYCNAYKEAISNEEKVLRQKKMIQWLKEGDQNSAYFHNSLKGRMYRSRIEVVYDAQGKKYDGDDIASKFVEQFRNFLGFEDEVIPIDNLDGLFIKKLDSQCAANMIRPVLNDEIKHAMFSIEDDKAAGSDGEFNANLILLVPKLKTPLKNTDYRPIACGNVVYKCISKVIVNRLKEGLSSIINCNQSAFIPGRQISDNIVLAQELVNGYSCKGGAKKCAFKVDIEKAYDMGCRRIKLTHLCFADDLLMLCHCDLYSASILRRALNEFSMSSGLYPNLSKSTVFYGNVPVSIKDEIQFVMPFREA
nr:hypothetical protein [Tanacetum cinerariifolium]